MGQVIGRWLAIKHLRLADNVEIVIGANGGKLRWLVEFRADAPGLVIVPEDGGLVVVIFSF